LRSKMDYWRELRFPIGVGDDFNERHRPSSEQGKTLPTASKCLTKKTELNSPAFARGGALKAE
ncbi:hypothetical protein, partial [Rhodocaloribacter sp.]